MSYTNKETDVVMDYYVVDNDYTVKIMKKKGSFYGSIVFETDESSEYIGKTESYLMSNDVKKAAKKIIKTHKDELIKKSK